MLHTPRFSTRSALVLAAVTLLAGCSDSGTDPEPQETSFRITAFSENMSCSQGACAQDIRGTARDSQGNFVSGATIFTSYTTSTNATPQRGPSTVTNSSGGYVMRFQFPVATRIDYNIRVCAGTTVREPDAQCAQLLVGFQ